MLTVHDDQPTKKLNHNAIWAEFLKKWYNTNKKEGKIAVKRDSSLPFLKSYLRRAARASTRKTDRTRSKNKLLMLSKRLSEKVSFINFDNSWFEHILLLRCLQQFFLKLRTPSHFLCVSSVWCWENNLKWKDLKGYLKIRRMSCQSSHILSTCAGFCAELKIPVVESGSSSQKNMVYYTESSRAVLWF